MGRLGIDPELAVISGRGQPPRQREIILQQHVRASDNQQRRRKTTQVAEDRRDVRSGAVCHGPDVSLDEELVGDPTTGRSLPAQVIGAELEYGAGESVDGSAVPQSEQRGQSERRSRRAPADRQSGRSEPGFSVSTSQRAAAAQSSGAAGHGCSGASR